MNNPISGLIILVACFLPDYRVGLATTLAGSIATLAEMVLQMQPWTSMRAGLTPLNAILVGSVISSLYPTIYEETHMDAKVHIVYLKPKYVALMATKPLSLRSRECPLVYTRKRGKY